MEIKQVIEQQVPKSKIMIYDPTQPRKNITISLTGTKETLCQAKEVLVSKTMGLECLQTRLSRVIIQQDYHRTSYRNHFDLFQKGVYYQHLKYLFKFL